jgi:hypothetical protein
MRFGIAGVAALAVVTLALVVALPAGAAGNPGTTQVITIDPTGAVFTCPGTNYTVLGGTLLFIVHDSIAADGSEHATTKHVVLGVTLTDGTTSTIYRLVGANSAEGKISPNGSFQFTDTTFFNILAPSGGVVGRVAAVTHVTSGGSGFSFSFGQCEAPQI